jgi:hypothetical protein
VTGALPALVSAGEDLAPERSRVAPTRRPRRRSRSSELAAADSSVDARRFGAAGSPTWVEGLETVAVGAPGRDLEGDLDAAIATLVGELRARGLFAPAGVGGAAPSGASARAPASRRRRERASGSSPSSSRARRAA